MRVILAKDDGTVLRAAVRALTVQRSRVMRFPEEAEQIVIRNLLGVEFDLDDFGVAGGVFTNFAVSRIFLRAARVTADDGLDSVKILKDGFRAPETAAAKSGEFSRSVGRNVGFRNFHGLQVVAATTQGKRDRDKKQELAFHLLGQIWPFGRELQMRLLTLDAVADSLMPSNMIAAAANPKKPTTTPNFRVGDERLIKLTENAARKVTTLLTKQGRASGVLRVAVVGGGCSGLQYKMDLQDNPANRDILVNTAGVKVVVDPKSALYVTGSELDYVDALQEGGFKVHNPNAATSCSCGESFSA